MPWKLFLVCILALGLGACTPAVQASGPWQGEPVLGGDGFASGDGARLPLRTWDANPRIRAVIVAVHGFNDYSNAFAEPAAWWAGEGITTYAYDQRGFGEGPRPGIWGGRDALTRDLAAFTRRVRERHPDVPLILLGESMGGAVVLLTLKQHRDLPVDKVVLSAPALWGGNTLNPFYRAMLWIGAHSVPASKLTGRGLGIRASDNLEMLRALGRDPLFIKETRIDSLYGLIDLMDAALVETIDVGRPLLVLYGRHEELVPEVAARGLLRRLAPGYRLAVYEAGWHMLLRDLQAETVWRDVAAWIADPDAPLPSGQERGELPRFLKR